MSFIPAVQPPVPVPADSWWFCFHGTQLLVHESTHAVPQAAAPVALGLAPVITHYLGTLDGTPCFAAGFDAAPTPVPPGYRFVSLRELFGALPEPLFAVATRAVHLAQWDLVHRFCGRCGQPLELKTDEQARVCRACGQLYFPQISPAVIVAVHRGDELLMARGPRFPPGMFSIVAGFVEAGETLETCAEREILEETGIRIRNLRYFGSQPWPYPNSLMLGFTAEYAGGEIQVDGVEVLEARWCRRDSMPQIPGKMSISRALIDAFLGTKGAGVGSGAEGG